MYPALGARCILDGHRLNRRDFDAVEIDGDFALERRNHCELRDQFFGRVARDRHTQGEEC